MMISSLVLRNFSLVLCLLCFGVLANAQQKTVLITKHGAVADGVTNNASIIQSLIDKLSAQGGGKLIIPPGNFLTGSLQLRSGVELHLELGARLLGSDNTNDYTPLAGRKALIYAKDQRNIAITGKGVIDGQGQEYMFDLFKKLRSGEEKQDSIWLYKRPGGRSLNIFLYRCNNVKVTEVTIKNSSDWVQDYKECDTLLIDRITVQSTAYWNNDGLDITDSRNVRLTHCKINATDDAICLKSENPATRCENIYIDSNVVRSSANGLKFGTASSGGFKNITVRNLVVFDTYRSAIALESVDGGVLENIDIRNVIASNTGNAIFIRRGHRNTSGPVGTLKNVYISNVKADIPLLKPDQGYPIEGPPDHLNPGFDRMPIRPSHYHIYGHPFLPYNLIPSSITGIPGYPVQDITLENIEITYGGRASKSIAHIPLDDIGRVPENRANYPEFSMFGELPAWGFYLRHVEGIRMKNVTLKYKEDDFRPAVVMDDASNVSFDHLTIPAFKELPIILMNNTKNIDLRDPKLPVSLEQAVKKLY